MKLKFLLFGIDNGGLFLARQLRKQYPEAFIIAIGKADDIGSHSRYIDFFYAISNVEDCHEVAKYVQKEYGDNIKAYICSNPMLEILTTRFVDLFSMFVFENDMEFYSLLANKEKMDCLCKSLGVCRPQSFSLLNENLGSIPYPVVVKPKEKIATEDVDKCVYIYNESSLVKYLEKCHHKRISPNMLLCQKCIEGNNRFEYGYGGYFIGGEPTVDICFHQFVQVPQGLCCYIREVSDDALANKIKSMAMVFVRHFKYTGIIEFDLKQDEITKQIYVLDINPRPWRSVDMLSAKLGKSTIFSPFLQDSFVIWRYPYRELFCCVNKLNVPYKRCREIANKRNHKTVFMSFDGRDIGPFVWQCKKDIHDFFNRIKRKIVKI